MSTTRRQTRAERRRALHLSRIDAAPTPAARLGAAVDYLRSMLATRPEGEAAETSARVVEHLISIAEKTATKGQ